MSGELVSVNKGITLSDEHKRKISESHVGILHSEETKQHLSELRRGTSTFKGVKTGEIVGRVSVDDPRVLSGEFVGLTKGKPLSDEHKRKISENLKDTIWIYNSELKKTTRIRSNDPIPKGWSRGRRRFK